VPDGEFDIKELSQRSGATPRTVHFYVQQGLLPPAGSTGPGARYGEGHLSRLKLIRLLQKQHLPLAEIARRLKGLSGEQVRDLLLETKARRSSQGGSALEYIRSVLADPSAKRTEAPLNVPAFLRRDGGAMHARLSSPASTPAVPGALPAPDAAPPIEPSRSQWDRYTLTDGIELNVRRPLARTEQRMLARLLDAARKIFDTSEEE
jgi:DNA-binding transcriptional MerR regulator